MKRELGLSYATCESGRQIGEALPVELAPKVLQARQRERSADRLRFGRRHETADGGQTLDAVNDLPVLVLGLRDIETGQGNSKQERLDQAALLDGVPDTRLPLEVGLKVQGTAAQPTQKKVDGHRAGRHLDLIGIEGFLDVVGGDILTLDAGSCAVVD